MRFEEGINREWLISNGLGGYASSTICGCNTRKYHGLLVASLDPPVNRWILLSKLEETIKIKGQRYDLSSNLFGDTINPKGYELLKNFDNHDAPSFTYKIDDLTILKTIKMIPGHNSVLIEYRVENTKNMEVDLTILPLITSRGIHDLGPKGSFALEHDETSFTAFTDKTRVMVGISQGLWEASRLDEYLRWWRNLTYPVEDERGYPSTEDLYSPGCFTVKSDESFTTYILAEGGSNDSGISKGFFEQNLEGLTRPITAHESRIKELVRNFCSLTGLRKKGIDALIATTDSFIVRRTHPAGKTIIAGYHWFSDFGRDTFISLPGLALVTKRFEEARTILETYERSLSKGLIPNNFTEDGRPEYHGVDASLWWIYGVQKYFEYTGDQAFIRGMATSLRAVVDGFIHGNGLAKVDEAGLVRISNTSQALTWMDVNTPSGPATLRYGRVVEINALWYNALRFIGEVLPDPDRYIELALKAQRGFEIFWNEKDRCLYDYVLDSRADATIRPNQILALSLPYSPIDRLKGLDILRVVTDKLLTPYGLRSLDPDHPDYHPIYSGGPVERDQAYHQGTVWSWLIGPYITACVKVHKRSHRSKLEARELLDPILAHIDAAGLGSISEIFDGDPPHNPRGCISQAWSVAEVLRCYVEDIIEIKRPFQ